MERYTCRLKSNKAEDLVISKLAVRQSEIKNLKRILDGISPLDPPVNLKFRNVITGIEDPLGFPWAFVTYIMLIQILKFKDSGKYGKVKWHTFLKFKNHNFKIRDYKGDTLSIEIEETNDDINESEILAKELCHKLAEGSKYAYQLFRSELEVERQNGNFCIYNNYTKYSVWYQHLKQNLNRSISRLEQIKEFAETGNTGNMRDLLIGMNNLKGQSSVITMDIMNLISIFYGMTEFLFLSFFILHKTKINSPEIDEFDRRKWQDKFNYIKTNLSSESKKENVKKLENIYIYFVGLKTKYRNPMQHGFNKSSYMILHPKIGIIPLSLDNFCNVNMLGCDIEVRKANEITAKMELFLKYSILWNLSISICAT